MPIDESVAWVRDIVAQLLLITVKWESEIEKALEDSGVNVKLSDDGMIFGNVV